MGCDDKRRDRLLKCLWLTTSPVEGEALAAVRKVNDLMRDMGLTWNDAFASAKPSAAANAQDDDDEDWEDVFATILRHGALNERWAGVITDMRDRWRDLRFLTEKQEAMVMRFYRQAVSRAKRGASNGAH